MVCVKWFGEVPHKNATTLRSRWCAWEKDGGWGGGSGGGGLDPRPLGWFCDCYIDRIDYAFSRRWENSRNHLRLVPHYRLPIGEVLCAHPDEPLTQGLVFLTPSDSVLSPAWRVGEHKPLQHVDLVPCLHDQHGQRFACELMEASPLPRHLLQCDGQPVHDVDIGCVHGMLSR